MNESIYILTAGHSKRAYLSIEGIELQIHGTRQRKRYSVNEN